MQVEVDTHKLMYHPERVAKWLEEGDCPPIYVEIGTTNRCNHRCIFCALDFVSRDESDIDKEIMIKTLEDMASFGVKSVMFAGEGESLLHRDISDFVKQAKRSGLDVALTTNGVLFDREKAEECLSYFSWIRFSVDAGTPQTYNKVHRGGRKDFERIIENIKNAVEVRNSQKLDTVIGVQFLLIPDNIDDVIELANICKRIGVDNLQVKPYSQHPRSVNKFVINYNAYSHLESELKKFESDQFKVLFRKRVMKSLGEEHQYKECHGLSFFALIDAKGNVLPCNLFYDNPEFTYGNLYTKSFSEIWRGKRRREIVEKIKERGIENCRRACRLDSINKYLNRLRNPQPHDNFI